MSKISEVCPHCNNTVAGIFSPSATRKMLTSLAKKGGMKAVMTYVGTVFPGIGNVGGFLAGAAIDFIYGDDINKFIDKIADEIDDNKIYVFSCPQCGHEWSRKEDDFYENYDNDIVVDDVEDDEVSEYQQQFNKDFDYYLEHVDDAAKDVNLVVRLCNMMDSQGAKCYSYNRVISSQYNFLAGLCNLLYAKENYYTKTVKHTLKVAKRYFETANSLFLDDEYKLMLSAAEALGCDTPEKCVQIDSVCTQGYQFANPTLFKEDWLIEIYDYCRFHSIMKAATAIQNDESNKYSEELKETLWNSGLVLSDKDYRMVCSFELFVVLDDDNTTAGKLSTKAALALNNAFECEGYSIETCDSNNYYDKTWLLACANYALSILDGTNPYKPRNVQEGLSMLKDIAELGECGASEVASYNLAKHYEDGTTVEQNLSIALKYYKKAGFEEDVKRLMKKLNSVDNASSTSTMASTSTISENEKEYIEEVKACLENGVISNGERRLLEKLRIKLGISETRAAEIESSLSEPQLTDEEQEYLKEYKECLAEGGSISASERRLLNKLRITLGISESRAAELEKL